ncbi:MAG: hypothetical protein JXA51_02675 [Dehalococcoidales bacterium]|nr:hypothetical protein [Dehalococcoidales bacterium]
MSEEAKRKRGGQKGNRNAKKHGFYAKVFDEAEQLDFNFATDIEGIDEEIALMRLEIKKALSGGDDRNLILLIKAAGALEKLIRTRYQISAAQHRGLKDAIGNVIRDILVPLGANIGSAVITKKLSG